MKYLYIKQIWILFYFNNISICSQSHPDELRKSTNEIIEAFVAEQEETDTICQKLQTILDEDDNNALLNFLNQKPTFQLNFQINSKPLISLAIESRAFLCVQLLLINNFIATNRDLEKLENIRLEFLKKIKEIKHLIADITDEKQMALLARNHKKIISFHKEEQENKTILAQLSNKEILLKNICTLFIEKYYSENEFYPIVMPPSAFYPIPDIKNFQTLQTHLKVHSAIIYHKQEDLETLLTAQAFDVNKPFNGNFPLQVAINHNNMLAVELLLRHNATIYKKYYDENSFLYYLHNNQTFSLNTLAEHTDKITSSTDNPSDVSQPESPKISSIEKNRIADIYNLLTRHTATHSS